MRGLEREKLFHAIVFFKENTTKCYKLKLFKLLHFLDFEIYRQTGRSTTGLCYFAWPMGPVPTALYEELPKPKPDMAAAFTFHVPPVDTPDSNSALKIIPKIEFDESHFTRREIEEMRRLAEVFYHADAETMTLASHAKGTPWHRIAVVEKRPQAPIPYKLAFDGRAGSISEELAEEMEWEARGVVGLFK